MNTPLISIIVPVYNVELYLEKCIKSLLKQTYPNFEIVLVDDGSKDNSGKICDQYSKEFCAIKTIHQKNGGLSSARNTGIKNSRGEYITFVDSDDYVFENYLSCLYGLIEKYDANMSCAQMTYTDNDNKPTHIDKCYNAEQMIESMCYRLDGIGVSACAKLYKKELVLKELFPEGMLFEDLATTHRRIHAAEKIAISYDKIYYVLQREGSIRHSPITEKSLNDGMTAGKLLISFVEKNYSGIKQSAEYRYAIKCMEYLQIFPYFGNEEKEKMVRTELRKYFKSILYNKKVKTSIKIAYLISISNKKASHLMWKTREKLRGKFKI